MTGETVYTLENLTDFYRIAAMRMGARRCYFSFEEEQLVISNRMKSTSYPYEQFGVIYETAERFYFYINAYNGYILEKSGIRNGSADQLREFLNSRREDAVETIELS